MDDELVEFIVSYRYFASVEEQVPVIESEYCYATAPAGDETSLAKRRATHGLLLGEGKKQEFPLEIGHKRSYSRRTVLTILATVSLLVSRFEMAMQFF